MDASDWIARLPEDLARQRVMLDALLQEIRRDPRWRWLELGCSIARGTGDALSDLDIGLGVDDVVWAETLNVVPDLLAPLGEIVDVLYARLPAMGDQPHHYVFAQYANGVQVDLVLVPAGPPSRVQPENIVLYDPDARRTEPWAEDVLQAGAGSVREWTFLGWKALADVAKYLQRGSLWEALERLHEARTQVWRLWAVAQGVRYPLYGLTAVLDHPESALPFGIESTVARCDWHELKQAAVACAGLLRDTSSAAAEITRVDLPGDMAAFVDERLRVLAPDGRS